MDKKHPSQSKPIPAPEEKDGVELGESDRKKLELGDAMEHEQGKDREENERDIEEMDGREGQ